MLRRISIVFFSLSSAVSSLIQRQLKWNLLFLILIIFFLFYGWRKWLLTVPQPLLQSSADKIGRTNALLGGRYYEVSIPPTGSAQYISADYRLWIPDGVETLRGLIVKQHGCGGDVSTPIGLDHANDLQWQALALKHGFALLGTKYPTDYQTKNRYADDPCNSWALIERGSEKAFLAALNKFSQKSRHSELVKIPWVLWGYSGGADWVMQMANKYPFRTIAVVAARGGGVQVAGAGSSLILKSKINSDLLGLPVLFALGEKDPYVQEVIELPKEIFNRYRKAGAIWAIAVEAGAGHETADTRLLAIPFLDAIISARLAASDGVLRSVHVAQGWLGNPTTHAINSIVKYKGNPLEAVWLPNEEIARKWQAYITTANLWEQVRYEICSRKQFGIVLGASYLIDSCRPNKIVPTRKSSAPFDVRVNRIEQEIILNWNFKPDPENGLPPFRIYRDNSLIATIQGQGYDGGDVPLFPSVILEFRDKKTTAHSTYAVSALNRLGESFSHSTNSMNSK
jgi:hypothetical protein